MWRSGLGRWTLRLSDWCCCVSMVRVQIPSREEQYIYIYYISTYHPSLEKIAGIVRHHWKEIEKGETLAMLFPEPPVVAFR